MFVFRKVFDQMIRATLLKINSIIEAVVYIRLYKFFIIIFFYDNISQVQKSTKKHQKALKSNN